MAIARQFPPIEPIVLQFRPIVPRARWRGIADDDFNWSIPISSAKPDLPFEKSSRLSVGRTGRENIRSAAIYPLLRMFVFRSVEAEFLRDTGGRQQPQSSGDAKQAQLILRCRP